jgi:putative endonuclease
MPRHHGEINLIGWDKDGLCFIEVKTRTSHAVKPAAAAVDREKRRAIHTVIRDSLRSLPERQFPQMPQWRFDVVTVHCEKRTPLPTFELFQNAALSS